MLSRKRSPEASVCCSWLFFNTDIPTVQAWLMLPVIPIIPRMSSSATPNLNHHRQIPCASVSPTRLEQRPILFILGSLLPSTLPNRYSVNIEWMNDCTCILTWSGTPFWSSLVLGIACCTFVVWIHKSMKAVWKFPEFSHFQDPPSEVILSDSAVTVCSGNSEPTVISKMLFLPVFGVSGYAE